MGLLKTDMAGVDMEGALVDPSRRSSFIVFPHNKQIKRIIGPMKNFGTQMSSYIGLYLGSVNTNTNCCMGLQFCYFYQTTLHVFHYTFVT